MAKTSYNYIRALQLEGRHPQDAGVWCTTLDRTHVGEGHVPDAAPQGIVEVDNLKVLPDVPKIIGGPKLFITYFRTLNSLEQVRYYLNENRYSINKQKGGVQISVPVFKEWINAPSGRIPALSYDAADSVLGHSIVLKECNDQNQSFKFVNNWKNWGDNSYGYLPYDYFEKYAYESKVCYVVPKFLREKRDLSSKLGTFRNWTARTTGDRRVYGFEFLGRTGHSWDRIAWCFLTESGDNHIIEDIYVRPEYRGNGYGRELVTRVKNFANSRNKSIILSVPFADCRSESPNTFEALVATTKRLGLTFYKSESHFAAYLAHNLSGRGIGASYPIEPDFIPNRPRSSLKQAMLAFGLMVSFGPMTNTPNLPRVAVTNEVEEGKRLVPEIGTAAWDEMNIRRNDLIRKEVSQGLDALTIDERKEYEWLQKVSLQAVQETATPSRLKRDMTLLREALQREAKTK